MRLRAAVRRRQRCYVDLRACGAAIQAPARVGAWALARARRRINDSERSRVYQRPGNGCFAIGCSMILGAESIFGIDILPDGCEPIDKLAAQARIAYY
jgi:hypothetical protein